MLETGEEEADIELVGVHAGGEAYGVVAVLVLTEHVDVDETLEGIINYLLGEHGAVLDFDGGVALAAVVEAPTDLPHDDGAGDGVLLIAEVVDIQVVVEVTEVLDGVTKFDAIETGGP